MPLALKAHLVSLGPRGQAKVSRDSVAALQLAWPHRDTLHAKIVIRSNVTMLRNLRSIQS